MRIPLLATLCLAALLPLGAQASYPAARDGKSPKELRKEAKAAQAMEEAIDETAAPRFDAQWVLRSEFLVLEEAYKGGKDWHRAYLGTMVTPPSKETKFEAEFFIVGGSKKGEKMWSKFYHKTRVATVADLKLGSIFLALDGDRDDDGCYYAAPDRETALAKDWFIGTLNDKSELYKKYVQLAGYKMRPDSLRVILPPLPVPGHR